MIHHSELSILFVAEENREDLKTLYSFLQSMPHVRLAIMPKLPNDFSGYDVVVTLHTERSGGTADRLTPFVQAGGGWLVLVDTAEAILPALFGVQPEACGPPGELRVIFEDPEIPLAERLPEAIYVKGRCQFLNKTAEEVQSVLYADWHYSHRSVLTRRSVDRGRAACTTLQAYSEPALQQILYRLLCDLSGRPANKKALGVGLLGYAPSVGKIHGMGAQQIPGLSLKSVCDLNPERLDQAREDFQFVKTYESSALFRDDPEAEVIIIATPPNTHARLCLDMMAAGKHVVCEKPLALNRKETDALVEMAEKRRLHLSCHQNRRWDPDFLTIKRVLAEGSIGDLFYLEMFVGGFQHPCGYWHSHAPVSGGTAYDWGAHYLDWAVALFPEAIETVVGTRHKRIWHDVTNADQERIQIRFKGGKEAEFMHSDIAAARKPKWYLLGTEGAIVGQWNDITAYEADPDHYYRRHDIPATEMTPDITVHRRHSSGRTFIEKPAMPPREKFAFHRNLADHLLTGEPIAAPLEDSVAVVAILEAAARSMAGGGTVEVLDAG